ncbi:MAG TPA: hypothetical protein VIT85_01040 [Solirubrobacterales bacterium]
MTRRAGPALAALVVVLVAVLSPPPKAAAAPLLWRLEQPAPPAGVPFKVPLGQPGDLQFWSPNRGLLAVAGNGAVRRGLLYWNGSNWRQLASVCGGPADTARIAWAGPAEFWVISEPSQPRSGSGLALCHFEGGQVVGSYSTRVDATDPYRTMLAATCSGPDDCWFGGIGSQDTLGEHIGAFHLHWNGSELRSVYGPQGRSVSDMEFHQGHLYESVLVGRSPENRVDPVDLAEEEDVPSLLHEISAGDFENDPFLPTPIVGVPDDGTELLALDSDGSDLWAVGGGAASGPSAPPESSVPRLPLAAHLVGGEFQELTLKGAAFGPRDRFGDVAALPGTGAAMATVVPYADRRSANSKATVAAIAADGSLTTTRLPGAGTGRGSAAHIACPAPNDCWMVTWAGWLFHYSESQALPIDEDPAFQGTIDFRPNEAAEQFIPDTLPEDDSLLFAPPPEEAEKEQSQRRAKRRPPLLKDVRSHLDGLTLTVSFVVTRKARVQLIAKRAGRPVARTPLRTFAPGPRALHLRLRRERYPTALAFRTKEVKR